MDKEKNTETRIRHRRAPLRLCENAPIESWTVKGHGRSSIVLAPVFPAGTPSASSSSGVSLLEPPTTAAGADDDGSAVPLFARQGRFVLRLCLAAEGPTLHSATSRTNRRVQSLLADFVDDGEQQQQQQTTAAAAEDEACVCVAPSPSSPSSSSSRCDFRYANGKQYHNIVTAVQSYFAAFETASSASASPRCRFVPADSPLLRLVTSSDGCDDPSSPSSSSSPLLFSDGDANRSSALLSTSMNIVASLHADLTAHPLLRFAPNNSAAPWRPAPAVVSLRRQQDCPLLGDWVTVEIKPKRGFLPKVTSATLLSAQQGDKGEKKKETFLLDLPEVKTRRCRFSMMQYYKKEKNNKKRNDDGENGEAELPSQYCPLDFFSGDSSRVRKALRSLFSVPSNNLLLFRNGCSSTVVSDDHDRDDEVSTWIDVLTCYFVADLCEASSTSEEEQEFVGSKFEGQEQQGVLSLVLKAQRKTLFDISILHPLLLAHVNMEADGGGRATANHKHQQQAQEEVPSQLCLQLEAVDADGDEDEGMRSRCCYCCETMTTSTSARSKPTTTGPAELPVTTTLVPVTTCTITQLLDDFYDATTACDLSLLVSLCRLPRPPSSVVAAMRRGEEQDTWNDDGAGTFEWSEVSSSSSNAGERLFLKGRRENHQVFDIYSRASDSASTTLRRLRSYAIIIIAGRPSSSTPSSSSSCCWLVRCGVADIDDKSHKGLSHYFEQDRAISEAFARGCFHTME